MKTLDNGLDVWNRWSTLVSCIQHLLKDALVLKIKTHTQNNIIMYEVISESCAADNPFQL